MLTVDEKTIDRVARALCFYINERDEVVTEAARAAIEAVSKPIVIVRIAGGVFEGIDFCGDVDVICHDALCKSEPYYQMTLASEECVLRAEVGSGPWPNAGDERHAAVVASIEEVVDGRSRLSVVKNDDEEGEQA